VNKLTLNIPSRTLDNFLEPISQLVKFLKEIDSSPEIDTIEFDYSDCKFTSPFLIAGLISLGMKNEQKGNSNIWNFSNSYLSAIKFPLGLSYDDSCPKKIAEIFQVYHDKTYIPIVCFPTGKSVSDNNVRENIINALENILMKQLNLKGQMLSAIPYLIAEATQNIVDHSNSGKGIIFAQYFKTKGYLDLCIADYGKGLYKSYEVTDKFNPVNTTEAMNFAVYGKSTKDQAVSRGFGISTSRDMLVNGMNGKYFIMSNDTFFIQTSNNKEVVCLPEGMNYDGCYVALRIPTVLENDKFSIYNYIE
jgi:anti-sigma regulatory factor (Ser/Thr protein kinase)